MCLIINRFRHLQLKPKVAKKDILCYKVLSINTDIKNGKMILTTPYQNCLIYKFNDPLIPDYFQKEAFKTGIRFVVNHGIHSFKNIIAAKKEVLELSLWISCDRKYVITPCYIPKGTKYWICKDGDYCSERLMFV